MSLPNGMKLYVVQRPAPAVTASLIVRHGASSVPAGKSGLAALTARMLTEGTKKRSSLELAEAVENLGLSLGSDAVTHDLTHALRTSLAEAQKVKEAWGAASRSLASLGNGRT